MATKKEFTETFEFDELFEDSDEESCGHGIFLADAYEELKDEHIVKCEEHRILQSKYRDLLMRFEELSAKVRVFVEETATDLSVKT